MIFLLCSQWRTHKAHRFLDSLGGAACYCEPTIWLIDMMVFSFHGWLQTGQTSLPRAMNFLILSV